MVFCFFRLHGSPCRGSAWERSNRRPDFPFPAHCLLTSPPRYYLGWPERPDIKVVFQTSLLLRGTGRAVFKRGCVAIYQQATVRHESLLEVFASGKGRNCSIFGVYYNELLWVIWNNRSCSASREKLLNSSLVRDCKVEGDPVLGLQVLAIITTFIFVFFYSSCRQRWDCKVKIQSWELSRPEPDPGLKPSASSGPRRWSGRHLPAGTCITSSW